MPWSSVKSASRSASVSKLITMARSPLRMTRARESAWPHPARRRSMYCSLPLVSISRPSVIGSVESLGEEGDLLLLAVFADLEVVLFESRKRSAWSFCRARWRTGSPGSLARGWALLRRLLHCWRGRAAAAGVHASRQRHRQGCASQRKELTPGCRKPHHIISGEVVVHASVRCALSCWDAQRSAPRREADRQRI